MADIYSCYDDDGNIVATRSPSNSHERILSKHLVSDKLPTILPVLIGKDISFRGKLSHRLNLGDFDGYYTLTGSIFVTGCVADIYIKNGDKVIYSGSCEEDGDSCEFEFGFTFLDFLTRYIDFSFESDLSGNVTIDIIGSSQCISHGTLELSRSFVNIEKI